MLEGLKKCEEDLLDVPSYGEPFGEVILERNRKLESKLRHFFSLKKRTPGHCILELSDPLAISAYMRQQSLWHRSTSAAVTR